MEGIKYCRVPNSVLDNMWALDFDDDELRVVLRIIQALYTEGSELSIKHIAEETKMDEIAAARLFYIVKGLESLNEK